MDYMYRYHSPIGSMSMASDGASLTGLWFDGQKYYAQTLPELYEEKLLPVFEDTIRWLEAYFGGEIAAIMAQQMGKKKMSAQVVGGAVGHNPVSIIIPCHRVVGADGSLIGYAGGIDRKKFLLGLERNKKGGIITAEIKPDYLLG